MFDLIKTVWYEMCSEIRTKYRYRKFKKSVHTQVEKMEYVDKGVLLLFALPKPNMRSNPIYFLAVPIGSTSASLESVNKLFSFRDRIQARLGEQRICSDIESEPFGLYYTARLKDSHWYDTDKASMECVAWLPEASDAESKEFMSSMNKEFTNFWKTLV